MREDIETHLNTQETPELEETVAQELEIPDPQRDMFVHYVGLYASGISLSGGDDETS